MRLSYACAGRCQRCLLVWRVISSVNELQYIEVKSEFADTLITLTATKRRRFLDDLHEIVFPLNACGEASQ